MLLRLLRPLWRVRRLALASEAFFWRHWLARRSVEMLQEDRAVPDSLRRFVDAAPSDPVRILEVGAGPVPSIGPAHPTRRVEVVATDVLAEQYNRMLRRRGVVPKVPIVYADAEKLSEQFGREAFDLVYAANCVDHMEDAPRAIREMLAVLRPGGYVVMDHFEDEGAQQDYAGMHQWNLRAEDGRLSLWNEAERHDLTRELAESCEVRAASADGALHVEIRKLAAAR